MIAPMFDLSGVIPEARSTVQDAATAYLSHTAPWFIGLLVHGSVVKGGVIPGCSDVDFQLYLEPSAFTPHGQLPLKLGLAIHRSLSQINPTPFRYIQCDARSQTLGRDEVGPVPGAYHLVAGRLPIAEASHQQLRDSAVSALTNLVAVPSFISGGLLEHGGGRLSTTIRLLCTKVWPMLCHVLVLQQDDPVRIWGLTKEQAIDLLPHNTKLHRQIRAFYHAVHSYYPAEESVDGALAVIEAGVGFLEAVQSWRDATFQPPTP